MKTPRGGKRVLKVWSFYYFDEDQIDALNECRQERTAKQASEYAGKYEHTLCRVTVEDVRITNKPKARGK